MYISRPPPPPGAPFQHRYLTEILICEEYMDQIETVIAGTEKEISKTQDRYVISIIYEGTMNVGRDKDMRESFKDFCQCWIQ
jgi:hypothetical protein